MKKLVLNEQQFNRLKTYINETKFPNVINKLQVGDVVKIDFKNSTNTFKIVKVFQGQVQMDNIDAGSTNINYRFFLTYNSLEGNGLELRRVHKIKEKDKLGDIKLWKPINISGIKNIEVIRNGKVIDKVDEPKPIDPNDQGKNKDNQVFIDEINNNLGIILNQLNEDKGLKLNMSNKEELMFCCLSRSQGLFTLELTSETKIAELKKWDSFIMSIQGTPDAINDDQPNKQEENLFELNKDIVKTSDGGRTFNLLVKANAGDKTSKIWINGIMGVSATPSCKSTEEHEKEDETQDMEGLKAEGKKALDYILSDQNLKDAFFQQPSLWNLFIAELKGKEATGKGIGPTLEIINAYTRKKNTEKLEAEFNEDKEIRIKPIDNISISYNKDNKKLNYTFDALNNEGYEVIVNKQELGENVSLSSKNKDQSVQYRIELLKRLSKIEDGFICNIILIVKKGTKVTKFEKEHVKFKILRKESPGYRPIQPKPEEKKPTQTTEPKK